MFVHFCLDNATPQRAEWSSKRLAERRAAAADGVIGSTIVADAADAVTSEYTQFETLPVVTTAAKRSETCEHTHTHQMLMMMTRETLCCDRVHTFHTTSNTSHQKQSPFDHSSSNLRLMQRCTLTHLTNHLNAELTTMAIGEAHPD